MGRGNIQQSHRMGQREGPKAYSSFYANCTHVSAWKSRGFEEAEPARQLSKVLDEKSLSAEVGALDTEVSVKNKINQIVHTAN